jgi:hypothetical protein
MREPRVSAKGSGNEKLDLALRVPRQTSATNRAGSWAGAGVVGDAGAGALSLSGHIATETLSVTSTFYYTLDTLWPYGQVILQSTIEGPSPPKAPPKPGPPTCKGTKCT